MFNSTVFNLNSEIFITCRLMGDFKDQNGSNIGPLYLENEKAFEKH